MRVNRSQGSPRLSDRFTHVLGGVWRFMRFGRFLTTLRFLFFEISGCSETFFPWKEGGGLLPVHLRVEASQECGFVWVAAPHPPVSQKKVGAYAIEGLVGAL